MTGTHGLVGLLMGLVFGWVCRRRYPDYPNSLIGLAAIGFVFGQFLPDADFILTVVIYPFDASLGEAMHRSFSHSFVVHLVVALIGAAIYFRRSRKTGMVILSLSAGMAMHTIQDVPFWFADIAMFWPVFHLLEGSPRWFGIWGGYTPPETIHSIIFSWEYGSIAVYLWVLGLLSKRFDTNGEYRSRLRLYSGLFLVVFLIALALVPFFDFQTHTEIIWGPAPLFWLLVLWITYRMRETIASVGMYGLSNTESVAN